MKMIRFKPIPHGTKIKFVGMRRLTYIVSGLLAIASLVVVATRGFNFGIDFVGGALRIGSVQTPSLIKEVKRHIKPACLAIIDVPPGTSCPVVETIKGVDLVLLVTEPTPFGLNDLRLAVELTRAMTLPFAVVINRYGLGDSRVEEYCRAEGIDVVFKLPDDRRIAEVYSSGRMIIHESQQYENCFADLAKAVNARI